jgi:hypothetical protein
LGYVGLAVILWLFRVPLFGLGGGDLLGNMKRVGFENLFRVGSVAGFVGLVMLFGMPFGSKAVHENLERIGFTNSAGETPLLVAELSISLIRYPRHQRYTISSSTISSAAAVRLFMRRTHSIWSCAFKDSVTPLCAAISDTIRPIPAFALSLVSTRCAHSLPDSSSPLYPEV